jgi:ATP-utilising chromatin assembly and remodelling N-terminal
VLPLWSNQRADTAWRGSFNEEILSDDNEHHNVSISVLLMCCLCLDQVGVVWENDCRDYLAQFQRIRQRIWTCAYTGKSNLTFEECLASEEKARALLQTVRAGFLLRSRGYEGGKWEPVAKFGGVSAP